MGPLVVLDRNWDCYFKIYFYLYVCGGGASVCYMCEGAPRGQERALDCLDLEIQWVQGTEHKSSGRTTKPVKD